MGKYDELWSSVHQEFTCIGPPTRQPSLRRGMIFDHAPTPSCLTWSLFCPRLSPLTALVPPRIVDNYPAYATQWPLDSGVQNRKKDCNSWWTGNLDCHCVWNFHIQHADLADLWTSNTVNLPVALHLPPYDFGCWLPERTVMGRAMPSSTLFILIGIQLSNSSPSLLQLIPEGSWKLITVNHW